MANVDSLRRQLRNQVRANMVASRDRLVSELQRNAPVDTGELRASIEGSSITQSDASTSFTVKTGDLIQAQTTERGARPHVIEARHARALSFVVGGRRVVVKRVNHPGNPPRPWFFPTVRTWPQTIRSLFR